MENVPDASHLRPPHKNPGYVTVMNGLVTLLEVVSAH